MSEALTIFSRLMAVLEDRDRCRPANSYTVRLLEGGVEAIGAKVLEESKEVIDAARSGGPDAAERIAHEAADLLYHLFVLLAYTRVSLDSVAGELAGRFGTSGLARAKDEGKGGP